MYVFSSKQELRSTYVFIAAPGAVIGIVIGSLALLLALSVAVILLVALRYRKCKSKALGINESKPPDV